jgi:hypothetical protein
MVVNNLNVYGPRGSVRPFKAHAPLIVAEDAVLAPAGSLQHLDPVPRPTKVSESGGGIELRQFVLSRSFELCQIWPTLVSMNTSAPKPVIWMGDSLERLQEFPATVQDEVGYAICWSRER